MKAIRSLCLVLVFALAGYGQVSVEQEVTTDTVNVLSTPQSVSSKSTTLALIGSLIIPGSGQYYMGRPNAALAYFATDVISLFGFIYSERYSKKLTDDASNYAWIYAGAQGGAGATDQYWEAVGQADDVDGYNRAMDLNRTPQDGFYAQNLYWHWADGSYRNEYNSIRMNSERFQVAASFFAGAMILNRVFSFIELRATTRSAKNISYFPVQPTIEATPSEVSLRMTTTF